MQRAALAQCAVSQTTMVCHKIGLEENGDWELRALIGPSGRLS